MGSNACVDQPFFAYESKLRYVRDSPEGAVKYSRLTPLASRHIVYPRIAAAKRRSPYPISATRSHHIPWRTYYARCR